MISLWCVELEGRKKKTIYFISEYSNEWIPRFLFKLIHFEGGLSGNISKEGNRTITFKLPYPDSDKLFIKVLGNEYRIKGPWNINIE